MDGGFAYVVVGTLAVLVIILVLIGRYYPGSGADVIDWQPTRSLETEIELEIDDIDQMIEAQNERRRRRGEAARSLEQVELDVARGLREQHARRDAYLASLETSEEAARDLDEMLAFANERRRRRGEPPITAERLLAELEAERARLGPSPPKDA
jgi:hypothetical protein